jgi:hypothetical protein
MVRSVVVAEQLRLHASSRTIRAEQLQIAVLAAH